MFNKGRNSRELAVREGALASRMGVDLALQAFTGRASGGPSFGREPMRQNAGSGGRQYTFGRDYGPTFGRDYGSFGEETAAIAADAGLHPSELKALIHAHTAGKAKTMHRASILDPNDGSEIQVQRYVGVAMKQDLTLGTPASIDLSQNPKVRFRPQRVMCNVPEPGFTLITTLQIANVNVLGGATDAWDFNANANDGATLDLPTIDPSQPVTFTGQYSGDLAGRTGTYTSTYSVRGPAKVTG